MINCRGLVLLSVLSLRNIVSIELESLDFPSYIIAGDSAVMSCLYKVSQVQESELDIKWYHGTSPSPFLVINITELARYQTDLPQNYLIFQRYINAIFASPNRFDILRV